MKIYFTLTLFLLSFLSHAQEIVKNIDGSSVTCKSRSDVLRHQFTGVYRIQEVKEKAGSIIVNVEFLRCVEINDRVQYVRDLSYESRNVSPMLNPERNLLIERKKIKILLVDESGLVIHRRELEKNKSGIYSVKLALNRNDYASDAKFSFNIQSKFILTDIDSGELLERGLESLGMFTLILK